jgi:peptide/nickel transport system permease protein
MPTLLWTDALFFLLLIAAGAFAWYSSRHAHLRAPWREVIRRPAGVASAIVLGVLVLIGVLDSMHFRPRATDLNVARCAPDVQSVLDEILQPLCTRSEKTYSAPFALYGFTREVTTQDGGAVALAYPRLAHGGAHLRDPAERDGDIARRAGAGALAALGLTALLGFGLALVARNAGERTTTAFARLLRGKASFPARSVLVTIGLIALAACLIVALGTRYHVFGTNQVGRDVLVISLKSIRTGLIIGTLTTLVMLPFACALGIAAGYFRGRVDDVIQYFYTTLSSIPGVLLIAAAVLSLDVYITRHADEFTRVSDRQDLRLLFLCIILGVTSWTGLCRLLRGETLKLREIEFVQAARAMGVSHLRVMTSHILPNVAHIILITVVLDFSALVLAEAVLSYVGVGVDPSTESFGNMINGARLELGREPAVWWPLAAAFVFMFALVLAANLFADAVRDAFDPRMRR